jgi:hypothetical protein
MRSIVIVLLLLVSLAAAKSQTLRIEFIGNCAFKITDNNFQIYTDFPYKSGAYGYMRYEFDSISIDKPGLCLITHAHNDHWNRKLFKKTGLSLYSPWTRSKNKKLNSELLNFGIRISSI